MDVALVTGAASGNGLAISKRLVAMGLRVYGLDPEASNCSWNDPEFYPVECDLYRQEKVALAWKEIIERDAKVSILIHAAESKLEGPLESAHPDDVRRCLEARLMGPALLTRYALARLIRIRGTVIYVSREGDNAISFIIAGGISSFAQSLFDEVRNTGMKVSQLVLTPNHTDESSDSLHTRIDPEVVASAVESIVRLPAHNVVQRMVVRPQATREEPFEAASAPLLRWGPEEVRLPEPENFPAEEEPILTPPRQRPADAPPPGEGDDDMEDEDDELDRMLEESRRRLKSQVERRNQSDRGRQQGPEQVQGKEQENDEGNRRNRRRRRGRRNRGRNRRPEGEQEASGPREHKVGPDFQSNKEKTQQSVQRSEPKQKPESRPEPDPKPSSEKPVEVDKAMTKKAARKATKKAAKKAVKKATKKVVKKAAKKATKKAVKKAVQSIEKADPESE